MSVSITFLGGSGTVTGSKYLVRHNGDPATIERLIDPVIRRPLLQKWELLAEQEDAHGQHEPAERAAQGLGVRVFAEARADNAVLLLDEADSFLYDRHHAEHSWERSQVNELLQGMERFDGIFIAATNLIDVIDKAAVRRFAYKLEFLPLTAAQCRRMLLTLVADPDEWQEQCNIGSLEGFTLGDFASVARTIRYAESDASLVDVLERLRGEAKMRGGGLGRRMGF